MSRHGRIGSAALIGAAVVVVCSGATAGASVVRAYTDGGGVGAWENSQTHPIDWQSYDSGPLGVLSHTMPTLTATESSAGATGYARADATVSVGQIQTRIVVQSDADDSGAAAYGQIGTLRLFWSDVVTLDHPTDATVDVQVDMVVDGSIVNATATGTGSINNLTQVGMSGTSIYGNFGMHVDLEVPDVPNNFNPGLNFPYVETTVFTATVGEPLPVQGGMVLSSFAIAGSSGDFGTAILDIDMSNTTHFFITPLTPGATLTSESGVDYANVIPAPGGVDDWDWRDGGAGPASAKGMRR